MNFKIILPTTVVLALTVLSCSGSYEKGKLRELDAEIAKKQEYFSSFEAEMAVLKDSIVLASDDSLKWNCVYRIVNKYKIYDLDSASVYAAMLNGMKPLVSSRMRFLSDMSMANVLVRQSRFPEASAILSSYDEKSLDTEARGDLYSELADYWAALSDESRARKEEFNDMSWSYKLKAVEVLPSDDIRYIRFHGHDLLNRGYLEDARKLFSSALDRCDDIRNMSYLTYGISKTYKNEKSRRIYWLAETSIWDLKASVRESPTLRKLAVMLYDDGDCERAANYIRSVLEDAAACNYPQRIQNALFYDSAITDALNRQQRRHIVIVAISAAVVSILCIIILLLYLNILRKSRKLKASYSAVDILNKTIEEYLVRHMVLSVENLSNMENFRKELWATYRSGSVDALVSAIRRPCLQKAEYSRFYKTFDETFLKIYPKFPSQVNALLPDNHKLAFDEDGSMCTPMRILATIRLGFRNSGEIATFLNCAPRSVYTHRSVLKNNAVCGPEAFEKFIMEKQ